MAIYMKIPGINGCVSAKGYENCISIDTFDLGIRRTVQSNVGEMQNRVKSIAHASEMVITKSMDKSSPLLFNEACVGKAIPEIKIDVCHTQNSLTPYIQYTLSNVLVSHYGILTVTDNHEPSVESISLNFTKIETRYIQCDPQNQPEAAISASHNISSSPNKFFDPADLPAIPDWLVDGIAGFGDGITFGLTDWIREELKSNGVVHKQSKSYKIGEDIGIFFPMAAGAHLLRLGYKAGHEIKISNNWRIAPFGNRTYDKFGNKHKYGRWPHYHRRGPQGANGQPRKAQGIGRHRPWETSKDHDKNFWDRF